jgi:hypothetical protein
MNETTDHEYFEFKEHLLVKRIKRLPKNILIEFWEKDIDFSKLKTLDEIVKSIVFEYKIRASKPDFVNKFRDFVRDYVLNAREADYLIHLNNPESLIDWVKSWEDNKFIGQNHDFYFHSVYNLNLKFLEGDDANEKISFPKTAIFLLGSNHRQKEELDGLDICHYHPTSEFEIIIRQDLDIVEIRGNFQVARDFVSTAILDNDNPLAASRSYFIGELQDKDKGLVKTSKKVITIDALKLLLNGSYRKMKSPFAGSKTTMIEMELDDLTSLDEETNPIANAALVEMMKTPVKGALSFYLNNKRYTFDVTKTGGLFFKGYTPEDVVTYIIQKIKLSSNIQNGKQNQ